MKIYRVSCIPVAFLDRLRDLDILVLERRHRAAILFLMGPSNVL